MHRKGAGKFLHDVCAINAITLADSDILARVRCNTANSEPYFRVCNRLSG